MKNLIIAVANGDFINQLQTVSTILNTTATVSAVAISVSISQLVITGTPVSLVAKLLPL